MVNVADFCATAYGSLGMLAAKSQMLHACMLITPGSQLVPRQLLHILRMLV
jgi:hypothetical protein